MFMNVYLTGQTAALNYLSGQIILVGIDR